jgi:FkbM family methyltransferase
MGIGAQSPIWRRGLFRVFASTYFCRKGQTDDGVFDAYVSPGSSLRFLDPRISLVEQVHRRFIRDWVAADSVVWDIGSNHGLFAMPAALKAARGRVYAFEPDVDLASNLLRSLRRSRNRHLPIEVFCVAVSDGEGTAAFQISRFSRAMNKLEAVGNWHDSQVATGERRSVVTTRIDTLANNLVPPTVIKIDVEGAEMRVLEGGEATIARYRPTMLVEGPSELKDPMRAFFEKHGYVILDGATETQYQVPLRETVWDTLAVPRERFTARTR